MIHRSSLDYDSSNNYNMFYTKYSASDKNSTFRGRFRSFQTPAYGNVQKMQQIDQMFNNYNLFKYGKCITGSSNPIGMKRLSLKHQQKINNKQQNDPNRYKNHKQRVKDNQNLRKRLDSMKNERKNLFEQLQKIRPIKIGKN